MEKDFPDPLDDPDHKYLVVGRYIFRTEFEKGRYQAMDSATGLANKILYTDVLEALYIDLPDVEKHGQIGSVMKEDHPHMDEKYVEWRFKQIYPNEYEEGIEWIPFDGMQKFNVNIMPYRMENSYQGVVSVDAFVWAEGMRTGCLMDIVNSNTDFLFSAETGILRVSLENNTREDIRNAHIARVNGKADVGGFDFPAINVKGIGGPVEFYPVDLDNVADSCGLGLRYPRDPGSG